MLQRALNWLSAQQVLRLVVVGLVCWALGARYNMVCCALNVMLNGARALCLD